MGLAIISSEISPKELLFHSIIETPSPPPIIYLAHEISTIRMAVVRHQCIAKSLGLVLDLETGTLQCFLYCRLLEHYSAAKERDLLFNMHFHLEDCDPAWQDQEN